jgi:hypothetical protein
MLTAIAGVFTDPEQIIQSRVVTQKSVTGGV